MIIEDIEDMAMKKSEYYFRQIANAVMLSGIIILIIGAYYTYIKAGIPYQDPPLKLQIQYAANMEIGNILSRSGFLIFICGGAASLVFKLVSKKNQKKLNME